MYAVGHGCMARIWFETVAAGCDQSMRPISFVNFGAFVGFMGVNVAALLRWYVRAKDKKLGALLVPVFGFLICFVMWLNLRTPAKLAGFGWLALGACLLWWRGRDRKVAL